MFSYIAASPVVLILALHTASRLARLVEPDSMHPSPETLAAKAKDGTPRPPIPLSQTLHFFARVITATVILMLSAVYGMLASIFCRAIGRGGLSQWSTARFYYWVMGLVFGIWFEVLPDAGIDERTGKEVTAAEVLTTRPAVFVGNHQTELDIAMLGPVFPEYCSITAKKSLRRIPFLGWFMILSKTIFLDRSNRTQARAILNSAVNAILDDQQSVYMFPEGTRSYFIVPGVLPFKRGAFHLAHDATVEAQARQKKDDASASSSTNPASIPIVPLVAANYAPIFSIRERIFKPGRIPIQVLPAIHIPADAQHADLVKTVEKTRTAMSETLTKLDQVVKKWNPTQYAEFHMYTRPGVEKDLERMNGGVSALADRGVNTVKPVATVLTGTDANELQSAYDRSTLNRKGS